MKFKENGYKHAFAHTFTRGYTYVQAYAYVCKML